MEQEHRRGTAEVQVAGAPWGDEPVTVRTLDRGGHELEPVVERDGARHLLRLDRFDGGVPRYVYARVLRPDEPAPAEQYGTGS